MQEKVAVAVDGGRVRLDGLGWAQVRPAVSAVVDRSTVPVKPNSPAIVTLDVGDVPTFAMNGDGTETVTVKSVKLKNGLGTTFLVSLVLVPVTITWLGPATVAAHDSVAVAVGLVRLTFTLVGLIALQLRPEGGVSDRLTVPEKPLNSVTVIVELANTPTFTGVGEFALMSKVCELDPITLTVIVVWWMRLSVPTALVPVTITEYDPALMAPVAAMVRLEIPLPPVILVTLNWVESPVGLVAVRLTVPAKALTALTVTREVVAEDCWTLTVLGLAETL